MQKSKENKWFFSFYLLERQCPKIGDTTKNKMGERNAAKDEVDDAPVESM